MQKLKLLSVLIIVSVVSFLCGKYSTHNNTEIVKSESVEQTKKIDTIRDVTKKETTLPNGTKIVETVSSTKRITDLQTKTDIHSNSKTQVRPDWRLGLLYVPKISGIQDQNLIFEIQRQIVSEIYLGLSLSTQKQIGLSLSIGI